MEPRTRRSRSRLIPPDMNLAGGNRKNQPRLDVAGIVGGLAAAITTLAAAIYGLGLVALVVPIHREASVDWSTAFFATSLIPRGLVVGYGLTTLVVPFVSALFFLVIYALVPSTWSKRPIFYIRGVPIVFAVLGASGTLAFALAALAAGLHRDVPYNWLTTLFIVVLPIAFCFLAGLHLGLCLKETLSDNRELTLSLPLGHLGRYPKAAFRSVLLVLCMSALIAFPYAALHPLTLPGVELVKTREPMAVGGSVAEGGLLSNSSGYWYILDLDLEQNEPPVIAVPSNEPEGVCIWESATTSHWESLTTPSFRLTETANDWQRLSNGRSDCPTS